MGSFENLGGQNPFSQSQMELQVNIPTAAKCKIGLLIFLSIQDERTATLPPNSVKLSYAQMVQKAKVAEVSANSLADRSDESDSEEAVDTSSASTTSRALKEQGQQTTQSNSGSKQPARGSGKDFARKDSSCDNDSRRDNEFRKENDYRREEPRDQRANRKLKENRERIGRRGDRRERDNAPVREREGPRAAVAK